MFRVRTVKKYGLIHRYFCTDCDREVNGVLMRITDWYTFFIVPVWPMDRKYIIFCTKCQGVKLIDEEEFKRLVNKFKKADKKVILDETFEGKTEVQVNFLKEMAQIQKEKEKQRVSEK